MVKATIYRDKSGFIYGYEVKGHNSDNIICNSVSVITQMPILGMEWMGYNPEVKADEANGSLEVWVHKAAAYEGVDCCIMTLLETMILGLKDLQRRCPMEIEIIER